MSRIAVSPELLRWASARSSKNKDELESRFPKLSQWLSGAAAPTLRQLEQFSKATSTPLGFLFLKEPPVDRITIPHFRTLDDKAVGTPSAELIDTLHIMQRRQDWLRAYLKDQGRDTVALVASAKSTEATLAVANRMREQLNLEPDWASRRATWTAALHYLREALSRAGVVVVTNGIVGNNTHRKLDVEDFRGFVLVDQYAPLIFVNGSDFKSAQMFTLAHEVAHLVFGQSAAFDLKQLQPASAPIEQACNRVAAEFLVPEALLRSAWNAASGMPVESVARAFKVSQIVAARRLLDLQLISRDAFFEFYQNYISRERRQLGEESGGNFYATAPYRIGPRFAAELIRALNAGHLLYTEAYRLTGLHGNTFAEFARRAQEGGLE